MYFYPFSGSPSRAQIGNIVFERMNFLNSQLFLLGLLLGNLLADSVAKVEEL
jgi:hypothetical protein